MAKGMNRGNREIRKPKKEKAPKQAPAPFANQTAAASAKATKKGDR